MSVGACLGSIGVCLGAIGGLLGVSLGGPSEVCSGIIGGPLEEVVDESFSVVVIVENVELVAEVLEEKFMVVCAVELFSASDNLRGNFLH